MTTNKNQLNELHLESSHLSFAFEQWVRVVNENDSIIDATCGGGKDTLRLAQMIGFKGSIIALDIQIEALVKTQQLLQAHLTAEQLNRIHLFHQSHVQFPRLASEKPIGLIVYNLGYLPQGDKQLTTLTETTLQSVKKGLVLVKSGGLISITCYPGHGEGKMEQKALVQMTQKLPPQLWRVRFYKKPNSETAPSLLLIGKT